MKSETVLIPFHGHACAPPMPSFFGKLLRMMTTLAILLVSLTIVLLAMENRIIYQPAPYPEGYWEPGQIGLNPEDVWFASGDGVRLHGWWVHHPAHRSTLIWFHGNAGNLSHRSFDIKILHQLGVNVFIFDYRGYGKSEGSPNEKGLLMDSIAAYDFLVNEKKQDPGRLIFYGRSIGGFFAIATAQARPAAGLIIESSFTSARDMAVDLYPFLPVRWLLRSKLDSAERVRNLMLPKLFTHGDQDRIVPFSMGQRLFEQAAGPKRFHSIPGADHNDTFETGGTPYLETLTEFIAEHTRSDSADSSAPTGQPKPIN